MTHNTSNPTDTLVLYHFLGCPYCAIVTAAIRRLNVNVELRDTLANPLFKQELVNKRDRATVPVLRIIAADGTEQWMPESGDIANYLEQQYG